MAIVGLGAWCDFVTEDEYRQRLVRDGWPPYEVENLVEESKRGVSFDVHEFVELAWEWLVELLHVHGIEATTQELQVLPYRVVFSERLRARVSADDAQEEQD